MKFTICVAVAGLLAEAVPAASHTSKLKKDIDLQKLREKYLEEDEEEAAIWADKPKKKKKDPEYTAPPGSDLEKMLKNWKPDPKDPDFDVSQLTLTPPSSV